MWAEPDYTKQRAQKSVHTESATTQVKKSTCPASRKQRHKEKKITELVSGRIRTQFSCLLHCTAVNSLPPSVFLLHDEALTYTPSFSTTLLFSRVMPPCHLPYLTLTHGVWPPVCLNMGVDPSEKKVKEGSQEGSEASTLLWQENPALPPFYSPRITSRHPHVCLPQADTQCLCPRLKVSALETTSMSSLSRELNEARKYF